MERNKKKIKNSETSLTKISHFFFYTIGFTMNLNTLALLNRLKNILLETKQISSLDQNCT